MVISSLSSSLEENRQGLLLWVPVVFGLGIVVYFALDFEPDRVQVTAVAVVGALSGCLIRPTRLLRTIAVSFVMLTCFGYSYSAFKTNSVSAPVLSRHYYGPVYGRIIGLDRSTSNARRVLLDQVYLPAIARTATPKNVRISLHGFIPENTLIAGASIAVTSSLSPPSPPVEPGGFDFRRMAWFMSLGGVGYTRNPVIPSVDRQSSDLRVRIFSIRMQISEIIKRSIPGQNGAFAAAIITGDRSEIDPAVLEQLRATNLAHLLAISGLHMALVSGFVFAALRYGLVFVAQHHVRVHPKKVAAAVAIAAGAAYLMISGASVATQRAYIMTTVVLIAVLLDRPALTLRTVALAALIVLIIKPYSVLEAGFQMSFAATTALISAYGFLNKRKVWTTLFKGRMKFIRPVVALLFTSAVAGAATAPISAFHFNQISQFGLIANLLAVPVMGMLVMPSAVVAFVLLPFGLEWLPFWVMGKGIGTILAVANYVSHLDGAVITVKSAPIPVLGAITLGGLVFLITIGKMRLVGLAALLSSMLYWASTPRPLVLVADGGKLFGFLTENGRVVNKPRGDGYAAGIWLENDGDGSIQLDAFNRSGLTLDQHQMEVQLNEDWWVFHYAGKDAHVASANCTPGAIVILPKITLKSPECIVIDAAVFREHGALSITLDADVPIITGSRDAGKNRPWGY